MRNEWINEDGSFKKIDSGRTVGMMPFTNTAIWLTQFEDIFLSDYDPFELKDLTKYGLVCLFGRRFDHIEILYLSAEMMPDGEFILSQINHVNDVLDSKKLKG